VGLAPAATLVPIAPMPPAAPLLGPAVVFGAHVAATGLLRVRRRRTRQ
jgi:hypothetical protein